MSTDESRLAAAVEAWEAAPGSDSAACYEAGDALADAARAVLSAPPQPPEPCMAQVGAPVSVTCGFGPESDWHGDGPLQHPFTPAVEAPLQAPEPQPFTLDPVGLEAASADVPVGDGRTIRVMREPFLTAASTAPEPPSDRDPDQLAVAMGSFGAIPMASDRAEYQTRPLVRVLAHQLAFLIESAAVEAVPEPDYENVAAWCPTHRRYGCYHPSPAAAVPVPTDTPTPGGRPLSELLRRYREQVASPHTVPDTGPLAWWLDEHGDSLIDAAVAARVPDTPTAVEVEDPTLLIRAVLLAVTDNALACNAGITIEDMCRYAETGELNDLIEARLAAAAPVGTEPEAQS